MVTRDGPQPGLAGVRPGELRQRQILDAEGGPLVDRRQFVLDGDLKLPRDSGDEVTQ